MNIVGPAAIVTGGASGLGAQTARELARRGARVAEFDRMGAGAAAVVAVVAAHGQAIGVASTSPPPTACWPRCRWHARPTARHGR